MTTMQRATEASKGGVGNTDQHLSDVRELIDQGESEVNIARFIAGHADLSSADRTLARLVLARHGLRRQSPSP